MGANGDAAPATAAAAIDDFDGEPDDDGDE